MFSLLLKSFYNSRAQVAKDHLWWNHMYKDCNLSHSILKTLSPHYFTLSLSSPISLSRPLLSIMIPHVIEIKCVNWHCRQHRKIVTKFFSRMSSKNFTIFWSNGQLLQVMFWSSSYFKVSLLFICYFNNIIYTDYWKYD
jgi:hypothetical protein